MKLTTLLTLAAGAVASAAVPPGLMYGVFRSDTGCIVASLSPSTGENKTIASTTVCDAAQSLFPAYSALVPGAAVTDPALVIAIASAPDVYSVDLATGKATSLLPMPGNNDTDFLLGLQIQKDTMFLVTQYSVYSAPTTGATEWTDLHVPLSAPQYSQVASTPNGGTGDAPRLFIADENSKTIYIVDTGAPTQKVTTVSAGVGGTILLQYSSSLDRLIELQSYQLYSTGLTGGSKKIGNVRDGPGYPRVNGVSPDGSTIAIIDFANIFTIDLTTGATGPIFPFSWAPKVVGFPIWIE